nr:pilus assembly protein [Acidobacteriota bacterium]
MTGRRSPTRDNGQAAVEFALVLPLFVVLIVALFDVTALARDQLLVDLLARNAARRASECSSVEDARQRAHEVIVTADRSDADWHMSFEDGTVTVKVSLEPRTSLVTSSMRWLGGTRRITGVATFVTEFEIGEQ